MTFDWANIVGLIGSLIFLASFAYANMAERFSKVWFNAANLAGAVLLVASLSVHFNLAAFALEAAWALIALVGLLAALRQERGKP
mgnify:FL=1